MIRHVWGDRPGDPALLQSAVDRILATALAAGHAAVPVWNQVLPGVPEGLAVLRARGLRLVAVSNSDGSAEAVLVATGLRDWFEAVIDSHHVGFSKPDPRLFDAARAVLGVQARNVAHVGDQYEADILGAHAAGIGAILIDTCGFWPECPVPQRRQLRRRDRDPHRRAGLASSGARAGYLPLRYSTFGAPDRASAMSGNPSPLMSPSANP